MDIYQIRLENFRAAVAIFGDRKTLAEKINMSTTLLNQYIGKNPTKRIGDEAARRLDLTLEAKDGRYRLRWHDYRYGVAGQKADDAELIKEALPYKKAMAALEQTSADIDACMAQPKPSQDW